MWRSPASSTTPPGRASTRWPGSTTARSRPACSWRWPASASTCAREGTLGAAAPVTLGPAAAWARSPIRRAGEVRPRRRARLVPRLRRGAAGARPPWRRPWSTAGRRPRACGSTASALDRRQTEYDDAAPWRGGAARTRCCTWPRRAPGLVTGARGGRARPGRRPGRGPARGGAREARRRAASRCTPRARALGGARGACSTALCPLLFILGARAGACLELKAPGFGVPGDPRVVLLRRCSCFGRYLVGLADVPHVVAVVPRPRAARGRALPRARHDLGRPARRAAASWRARALGRAVVRRAASSTRSTASPALDCAFRVALWARGALGAACCSRGSCRAPAAPAPARARRRPPGRGGGEPGRRGAEARTSSSSLGALGAGRDRPAPGGQGGARWRGLRGLRGARGRSGARPRRARARRRHERAAPGGGAAAVGGEPERWPSCSSAWGSR